MNRLYAALPIFAQNWAVSLEGRRRARERFTPRFHAALGELLRSVSLPLPALRRIQAARLTALVDRARAHAPHYRDIPPPVTGGDAEEAIARTLAAIPPLEKAIYRERFDEIRTRDLPERELVAMKTSGTTGTALPLLHTRDCVAEWFAVAWRQRRLAGAALRDPYLTLGGQPIVPAGQTRPPFWRTNAGGGGGGRQTLLSGHHLSPAHLPAYVEAVHALPARYVQGYPSALALLGAALSDAGRPLPPGRLRGVFTSSETLLPHQRRAIEEGFGARVHDFYSATEAAVAMTGCAAGRLHVDLEFCIVEVEVAERGPGFERGELLVTGLATTATPLLRYRIGDVGTRATDPCPCGRAGDSFLHVDGRIEDYVVTPDGRRIGRMDHVFKDRLDVAEAQLVQDTVDRVVVRVVARPGFDASSEAALVAEIRSRVGPTLAIAVERVAAIPREANGKLRAVRSSVGRIAP